jgi:hypothetical protein
MTTKPVLKAVVYLLLIALSLVALWLASVSPSYFMDNNVVYQGF